MLRNHPGFGAIVVLSLALGIGANAAIFTLIDAILLKSLPVKEPGRLVVLRETEGTYSGDAFEYPSYVRLRGAGQAFTGMFAYSPVRLNAVVDGETDPYGTGLLVTGNYFSELGVNALIGRTITPDDDRVQGAHPVAVISFNFWKRRFAQSAAVLNRTILLAGTRFTIIGVTPPEFFGTEVGTSPDFFVPVMMQVQVMPGMTDFIKQDRQRNSWLHVMGRLRPGISKAQALASLQSAYEQIQADSAAWYAEKFGSLKNWGRARLEVVPGAKGLSDLRRQFSKPLIVLMGVVGLVLLIACANVASLLLVRAVARQKEMAVRLAVGAGRSRLVRQLLTESLIFALASGFAGVMLAWQATRLLLKVLPHGRFPLALHVTPDARTLGFTVVVSIVTGLLFGLAPAFRSTSLDLGPALKDSTGTSGGPRFHFALGKVLVSCQVALAFVLLLGAVLLIRTLQNLRSLDLGFAMEHLLSMRVEPPGSEFKSPQLNAHYKELLRGVQSIPGVRSATLAGYSPISRNAWERGGSYEDVPKIAVQGDAATANGVDVHWIQVYPGYFTTMGIALVGGRDLSWQDIMSTQPIAVINQSMARALFGNRNPIGQRIGWAVHNSFDIEIVGVVKDAKYGNLREPAPPMFYHTFAQARTGRGQMTLHVRSIGNPAGVALSVRREVQRISKDIPMFEVQTMTAQVDESLTQERLIATLSGFFGGLALLLASIGLYGTMSYTVSRRTSEIGIRMALGAQHATVIWLVLRESLRLILVGMLAGLPVALLSMRLLSSLLFGLKPADPATIGLAVVVMLAVAVTAGYIPARRASRVDPIVALRYE